MSVSENLIWVSNTCNLHWTLDGWSACSWRLPVCEWFCHCTSSRCAVPASQCLTPFFMMIVWTVVHLFSSCCGLQCDKILQYFLTPIIYTGHSTCWDLALKCALSNPGNVSMVGWGTIMMLDQMTASGSGSNLGMKFWQQTLLVLLKMEERFDQIRV